LLATLCLAFPAAAQEHATRAPRPLSLEEALRIALERNPDVRLASVALEGAEAGVKAARGAFGPRLKVEGNVMRWDEPLEFSLGGGDAGAGFMPPAECIPAGPDPPPSWCQVYRDLGTLLGGMTSGTTIRDQVTASLTVTAAQPITPLYAIYHAHRLRQHGRDAAVAQSAASRADVTSQVKQTYLRLLQISRMEEIARSAVEQITAHRDRAAAFQRAGLIGRNDVLKAGVALAQAREGQIKAQAGVALLRTRLNTLLGLPPHTPTQPIPPAGPLPEETRSLTECTRQALERRPELTALAHAHEMADAGVHLARSKLIPSLVGLATYMHTEGQGTFSPEDSYFLGAMLSWDAWEWGSSWYGVEEAESKRGSAKIMAEKVRDLLALDVKKAHLDLLAARERIAVTGLALGQARENLRIEQEKFEAHTTTTTDLLDAQSALTRAELSQANAYYDRLIAQAALEKATGVPAARLTGAKP